MSEPDLTAELDAAEEIVTGDDAVCRHCGELIVPCTEAIRFCKGWKHVRPDVAEQVAAHWCEGPGVSPLAEPGIRL